MRRRCWVASLQSSRRSLAGRGQVVQHCYSIFDRMEAEMTIVSEESRELADTLEEREMDLLMKVSKYPQG